MFNIRQLQKFDSWEDWKRKNFMPSYIWYILQLKYLNSQFKGSSMLVSPTWWQMLVKDVVDQTLVTSLVTNILFPIKLALSTNIPKI